MTDQPQIRGATPDDIEAALQDVRAGLGVADAAPGPQAERRPGWAGTGGLLLVAALLGAAAALYLPGMTGQTQAGAEDTRRRLGDLELRVGQLAAGDSNEAAQKAFRDLAARLEGVEMRVRALEATAGRSAPAAPQPDPALAEHLARLDEALGDLTGRLATLEQQVAGLAAAPPPQPVPVPPPAPAQPSIDAQALAELVARVDAVASGLDQAKARLSGLEQRSPSPDLVAALDRRISELENADPGRAARNAALALTVGRLGDAVAAGRPFAAELAALKLAAPSLDTAPFEPYAAGGLPTVQRLASELEALDGAIRAGADEDRGGDWLDRFWRGLGGLVIIRPSGEPIGDAPEDRLDRALRRLAEGDLRAAVSELDWLWGHAREAAEGWIARAKARLALNDALTVLTDAILHDLAQR